MSTTAPFFPPVSDGQLVAACLAGEPGAVECFFARFHRRLVEHLTRHVTLGRIHDAEDLTQEALNKALGAFGQFDQTAPLWPWLRRIGENAARDHYRLARHRREVADEGIDLDVLLPPTEDHAARQAERDHVQRALQALPRRHREVVVEVDMKQTPQREVAAMFGISYPALRKRLDRGRAAFRQSYEALAGLPVFQWLAKLGGSKLAASSALSLGLSAAIPALIIAGLALAPAAGVQARFYVTSPGTAGPAQSHSNIKVGVGGDVGGPTALHVFIPGPSRGDTHEPPSAVAPDVPRKPAGAAAGVRAPEVTAPIGGVRTSNEFEDGPGFTTYSVPATDLDGSGPLEVSNDTEEVEPVHAAACDHAGATDLADCRQS